MSGKPQRFAARFTEVSLRFNSVLALNAVSIDIPAGRLVGLIGPDGVGKSTMLDLLAGARALQVGRLEVLGIDISNPRLRQVLMSRMAYMPQGLGRNLYDLLSVEENLEYFTSLFGNDAASSRCRIDVVTKITGLYPFLSRKVRTLSGGMRQKLGLCCALIHDPDLLILDEPTTGVDPLSRLQFWSLIHQIRRAQPGLSIVVATAIMEEAAGFDELIVMNEGRILAYASPQDLLWMTRQPSLESAFIALLPESVRRQYRPFVDNAAPRTSDEIAIEARHLSKRFDDILAVDNVTFQIRKGEIFGFVGSNGCGKTTTMKMLTGLIPATQGEAFLLGRPVALAGQSLRRKVGYMTQNFSLYAELTVRQNLELHGRLFDLKGEKLRIRIDKLIARFGLGEKSASLASALPLGHRQRLSLAVSMVHEPEILILDEPTAGVDPIARDEFWHWIVELSRQDQVTILISTHFMNEAERCDRIALMHDGKLIDSGVPRDLALRNGGKTLQEAFILCISPRHIRVDQVKYPWTAGRPRVDSPSRPAMSWLKVRPFFSVARRELLELRRDPVRSALSLFGSLLMMFVIGLGISLDVNGLRFAVLDRDQTPDSRDYISAMESSAYFLRQPDLSSPRDLDKRMRNAEVSLAIEIPEGFARRIHRGETVELGAWIDGAMPQRAATIQGYLQGAHQNWVMSLEGFEAGYLVGSDTLIEVRYRYNPEAKSLPAIIPAVIPMILLMLPAVHASLSVVREKELGSIVNFYVTPISRSQFLLGKQAVYVGLGMLNFVVMCFAAVVILKVPMTGSLLALCAAMLLFITCATGLGLLTGALTRSQIAAIFFSIVCTMIPAVQFSGLINPVSSLEGLGRVLGEVYPASHIFTISRGVFSKAQHFSDLQEPLLALLIAAALISTLSILVFRKQAR
jgi:ribosome-dependent ATPase